MEAWPNAPGCPSIVATLPLVFIVVPGGSPVAVILNVSEQVSANVTTTLVIPFKTSTVCDCGPEVSVPDIVHELHPLVIDIDSFIAAHLLAEILPL